MKRLGATGAACLLLFVLLAEAGLSTRRQSVGWDEGDHMFAAYMMAHTGDYGLNPEHPPLVKFLAAVPLIGRSLWVPQLHNRFFKGDAYAGGRDWLARNDGDRNQIVFEMRLAAGLLALACCKASRKLPAPESAVTNHSLLEVLVPVNPGSRYFRLRKP